MSFWRRPQTHLARRVMFQIHVWTGVVIGLYSLFIGLTGAVLIFRAELQSRAYPQFFAHAPAGLPLADASTVLSDLEQTFPGYRFSGIDYPGTRRGTFLAYLSKGDELKTVFSDPVTGRVIGELPHDGWIQRLQDLHFNFLAGQQGYVYNGIAASCLLVMCLTGVVIWWPGVSRVSQAFVVNLHRGWKRVIWELHAAVGIWVAVLLFIWSVSGIYFSFPGPFRTAVGRVVSLSTYRSFVSGGATAAAPPTPEQLIARALARVPDAALARFVVPVGEHGTYSVVLAPERDGDADSGDEVTVYFDRYTGAELAITDQGERTAGETSLTWLGRLHVGNFGGLPIKIVWFVGALLLPLLFVTGATMWWNRFMRPAIPVRAASMERQLEIRAANSGSAPSDRAQAD